MGKNVSPTFLVPPNTSFFGASPKSAATDKEDGINPPLLKREVWAIFFDMILSLQSQEYHLNVLIYMRHYYNGVQQVSQKRLRFEV